MDFQFIFEIILLHFSNVCDTMKRVMNVKVCSFEELHTLDFEITSMFAQKQKWIDGVLFTREKPRATSAFVYLSGCTGQYTDLVSGKTFYAPQKSLVYIPYGSRYTVLNMESQKARVDAYLMECNVMMDGEPVAFAASPVLMENPNPYYIEKMMRETVDAYEAVICSPAMLKSKVYELLAYVSGVGTAENIRANTVLKPAMEHIEKQPFDCVPIDELAEMCGMSSGGFRRLFKQQTGKTPKEYILDIKLTAAKSLLEESGMSVREIADVLNFDTVAYFCRFFKQKTGMTPGEYSNR